MLALQFFRMGGLGGGEIVCIALVAAWIFWPLVRRVVLWLDDRGSKPRRPR